MKIIKRGEFTEWYYKVQITCGRCKSVFQLEDGDTFKTHEDQREGASVSCACPVCSASAWKKRPTAPSTNDWNGR